MNSEMRRIQSVERIRKVDDAQQIITAVIATETKNPQDGIILRVDGFICWGEQDRVPLLWEHGADQRGYLPIGVVENFRVEEIDGLRCLIADKRYYKPTDPELANSEVALLPQIIFDMRKQGIFKAVSVRFSEIETDPKQKNVFTRWWLYEVSDCAFGADPQALDIIEARRLTPRQMDILGFLRKLVPFEATPMMEQDAPWDAAEARARIAKWASSDGSGDKDKIDWGKYARAFLWIDQGVDTDNFGAYYLPHHDVVDGRLKVNFRGCAACLVVLNGGRGGPPKGMTDSEIEQAKRHIARHYEQFGVEFPDERSIDTGEGSREPRPGILTLLGRLAEKFGNTRR